MSTTDLYILNGKSTSHVTGFKNGWGSASLCWWFLSKKYLGRECSMFDMNPVWALHADSRLTRAEYLCLMLTFDKAYIPIDRILEAAEACIEFGETVEDPEKVNHWIAIGLELKRLAAAKHNRHARGVCMSPTSVSDMWCWPSKDQLADAWSIFEDDDK